VYAEVLEVLDPLIGRSLAVMCVRSAAVSIGKPAENLDAADFARIEAHLRSSLSGITTADMLDVAVSQIRGRVAA